VLWVGARLLEAAQRQPQARAPRQAPVALHGGALQRLGDGQGLRPRVAARRDGGRQQQPLSHTIPFPRPPSPARCTHLCRRCTYEGEALRQEEHAGALGGGLLHPGGGGSRVTMQNTAARSMPTKKIGAVSMFTAWCVCQADMMGRHVGSCPPPPQHTHLGQAAAGGKVGVAVAHGCHLPNCNAYGTRSRCRILLLCGTRYLRQHVEGWGSSG
jgi:hypothetical protein